MQFVGLRGGKTVYKASVFAYPLPHNNSFHCYFSLLLLLIVMSSTTFVPTLQLLLAVNTALKTLYEFYQFYHSTPNDDILRREVQRRQQAFVGFLSHFHSLVVDINDDLVETDPPLP